MAISHYAVGDVIREELVILLFLPERLFTRYAQCCDKNIFGTKPEKKRFGYYFMVGLTSGFIQVFVNEPEYPAIQVYCIMHQKALRTRESIKKVDDILKCHKNGQLKHVPRP